MRERIAQLAARMIAQDGMQDYSLAKRKAARQLGVNEIHSLPGNREIEQAIRAYQDMYQKNDHLIQLQLLRKAAYSYMRLLEKFNPYLVGPVLNGSASWNSDVNIQLATENVKEVELFLLARKIPYQSAIKRIKVGIEQHEIPVYKLLEDGVVIELAVVSPSFMHAMPKASAGGEALERAKVCQVALLIEQVE
ncbi:hypothetical protein EDC63_12136 [Sulfurirhabdus autotrophica]|uniref:Nucleotidyltransferase-like protein n=2 Tax=Sulfurirhabdus autotrophica TaxID=1706046 RepID=A0A4R3XTZ9_9PROT|nr:hypothetical protein EDC63_12136 [Sulfurirhabdus autotrophica]